MTRRRQRPGIEALEARWLLKQINEFPVPSGDMPSSITSGPDGNLWFTESSYDPTTGISTGQIGMINPTTHAIAEFPVPSANAEPGGITSGPDGNLWFTESRSSGGQIGMINPTTHAIAEFPVPSTNAYLGDITSGPDGNLWFTEGDQIGMINPMTHAIAEFPIPGANAGADVITSGPDGNLWFTENSSTGSGLYFTPTAYVGMINPTTHAIAQSGIGTTALGGITSGPDGNIWFTDLEADQIGMINPTTHAIAEFPIPTANSYPAGITTGPDGNLWFTESSFDPTTGLYTAQVGMINPTTHAIAEFPTPTPTPTPTVNAAPGGITSGPDGNLWFTDDTGNTGQIGEVVIAPSITVVIAPSITGVVSVTHSKKEITAIILGVNEPLNPASASTRGFYSLDSAIKKRHTLVFSKPAKIRTVLYDSTTDTVTLKLAKPSKGPIQVMVHSGVMATNGISTRGTFTAVVK